VRISGFSFCRNAVSLYYPIGEAIRSALPIVDEFVIAVGESDDDTVEVIRAIGDPKVRIIETSWDPKHFVHGAINAVQTNIALDACSGDWCLYLQADEVLHEADHAKILRTLERVHERPEVEGLLFDYLHFWGAYDRYQKARNWYRNEVRVVRNGIGVRSWKSAQGFRIDGRKLRVVRADGARIFHYGWVRPPRLMKRKSIALDSLHHDRDWVERRHPEPQRPFDYGPLDHLARFTGTHPAVMRERIANQDWTLPPPGPEGLAHEHNRLGTRVLGWIERNVLRTRLGEYRNYVRID
jgi:glycosyltransferase involved in cell wall biosynthesis